MSESTTQQYRFGHALRNNLVLCNETGTEWLEIGISTRGNLIEQRRFSREPVLLEGEFISSYFLDGDEQKVVAITNKGDVYQVVDCQLRIIPHNYTGSIEGPEDILIDINGDYWVSSRQTGLYKISLEPFTKIRLHPLYESPEIVFPYITSNREVIIGLRSGTTHIGSFGDSDFSEFPLITLGAATIGNDEYLATNVGVKKLNRTENGYSLEDVLFNNEKINFILGERDYIWVGVAGRGLFRINHKEMIPEKINLNGEKNTTHYFYTGQISGNGKSIFFGTNDGILYLDKTSTKLKRLSTPSKFGSYSGCSTKDVNGNGMADNGKRNCRNY